MLLTVRVEKVYEKNGVICLFSMFPFWVMVLISYCLNKYIFLQCCLGLNEKSKFIKEVYRFAPEVSRYGLSENGIVYNA